MLSKIELVLKGSNSPRPAAVSDLGEQFLHLRAAQGSKTVDRFKGLLENLDAVNARDAAIDGGPNDADAELHIDLRQPDVPAADADDGNLCAGRAKVAMSHSNESFTCRNYWAEDYSFFFR